jgi:putative endonuclease
VTIGRSTSPTHQQGAAAEDAALQYMLQQHCHLVVQNFNTPFGELDLVMRQGQLLLFVEVRMRKKGAMVSAAESVTVTKQRKIIRSAQFFLQRFQKYADFSGRFDVLAMTPKLNVGQPTYEVDWIQSAFDAYAW